MKVPQRIKYSPDVDILMIQFSNKKIDDSYDLNDAIVQVDKDGEPVIIEMFNGKKHLEELGRSLPRDVKQELAGQFTTIPHQVIK